MFRSRLFRALALLAGMTLVVYLAISLFLPSSRRLIFGVDKTSGKVRLVRNHVTFLPPHQFYRLSFDRREGDAQRDGVVRILSKERVPVTITYRLRFSIPGERLPDARRMVRDGWSAWMRSRVAEAVSAVTQQVPIEELLSPTSQFAMRRDVLRQVVTSHLGRSGLRVTAFEIARLDPDREALLDFKRRELRRNARGAAGRVAVFAIDGADWTLLTELSNDGRIPNIRALIQGGVTGSLQTIQPTVSPLVWTTAATGLSPDRHAVFDFIDPARKTPVDATSRRTPAIWDIAEAFERSAVVVNWWTSWPPQLDSAVTFDTPVVTQTNAIFPSALAPAVAQLAVPISTVQSAQVRRFLNITPAEYEASAGRGTPGNPVNVFRNVLAKTWTDHRVATRLYQQQQPLLMMMSFEGTDTVNHLFAPYHPPLRDGVSAEQFRRYWPAVANYYSEVDRLIGEWMKIVSDDTTIIVMSSYGFHWDKSRPHGMPAGRSALADHRNPGVFIAYGSHVAASRGSHSISIYDVVPSILAILGLPESMEMQGSVPGWLFRDLSEVRSVRVVSYDEFFARRPAGVAVGVDRARYTSELQTIGHMADPSRAQTAVFEGGQTRQTAAPGLAPAQWGAYAYYNNLGVELRRQKKLKEATDAFQKAIDINPRRPTPYLNMAITLFDRQEYAAADDVFVMAVVRGLPNGDRWFADFAGLYRARNMPSRAAGLLIRGKEIFPQSYVIAANLGSALAQSERYSEGLLELERALSLRPSSTLTLNNLGIYYSKRQDYARALDFWNRSLTIDARQPEIREAAEAARTHL